MNYVSRSGNGEELYFWIGKKRFTVPLDRCLDVILGDRRSVFIKFDRSIEEGGLVGKDK